MRVTGTIAPLAFVLTLGTASLSATGVTPSPTLATVGLSPASGTLTISGTTPTLRYDFVIGGSVGVLQITGVSPSLSITAPGAPTGRPGLSGLSAMTGLSGGGEC